MRLKHVIMLGLCVLSAPVAAQDAGAPSPEPHAAAPSPAAPSSETAAPTTTPAPAAVSAGPDVSAVRAELSRVMDELIAARARTSILAKALFNAPLSLRVVRRADDQRLEHITLRLDGATVHDSDGAALAGGEADLYEGFVAPGVHEVAIEITEVSKTNGDYRYVRSERFRIEIKKGMRTSVQLLVRDKSDMAEELPDDDDGEYDVSTLMRVQAEPVKGN